MYLKRLLGVGLLLTTAAASMAAITMTVNVKDGQTISGDFKFEVRVQSSVLVNSVEFYLDDDLRSTDESTPYEFTIDTLVEKEGKVTATFAAYNTNGESVKKSFNLVIDNDLGKGIQFHIDAANEQTRVGNYRDAIQSARKALKIDKNNNEARMAMARANYAAQIYDIAQKFAEDVVISDPDNADAKALLAAINLKRAFGARGSNQAETNKLIGEALKAAASAQRDIIIAQSQAVPEPAAGESIIPWIDAQLKARRFTAVAAKLRPDFEKNIDDPALANRFIYALLNSGRIEEAIKSVNIVDKYGSPDAYSYALKAAALQLVGETVASEAAEKEVLLEDPTGALTKFLQAHLSIARKRSNLLPGFVRELEATHPDAAILNYYKSTQSFFSQNYDQAVTDFETGLLANPASPALLVERGNQVLESLFSSNLNDEARKERAQLARSYFEAALTAQPDSFEALNAVAIANLALGATEEAISYAKAAVAAGPEYGGAYFTLAGALRQAQVEAAQDINKREIANDYRNQSQAALDRAGQLDKRLKNQFAPAARAAWLYAYGEGRIPVLPIPPTE